MSEKELHPLGNSIGEEPATSTESDQAPKRNGIKWIITVFTILSSTFLFALDNTIVANIQPAIINDFNAISKLPWLGTAFSLGGVAMLPWGKAYGIFNIKWLFIASVVIFEAGSALCGGAPNIDALIVGRAIAGFGGAGMYSGALVFLAVTPPPEKRPWYMGIVSITWGIGTVLGPVVGGGFAISSLSWRWAFYINLLIAAVMAPFYLFSLPSINLMAETPLKDRIKMLDWIGTLVFFCGMACFTMAISFGGTVYAWNSGSEISLLVLSAVALLVMFLVTKYHPGVPKQSRLYPGHLVKRPIIVNLQLQTMLGSGILQGTAYYIPLFFQLTRGDSPLLAAARLIPYIVLVIFASSLNGFLVTKIGYYKPSFVIGTLFMSLGAGLMLYITPQTSNAMIYGFTIITGFGNGLISQTGYSAAQALVHPSEIPNAIAFMGVAQDFGAVFILAIAGTAYDNVGFERMSQLLQRFPQTPALITLRENPASLLTGTSGSAFSSLDPSLQSDVVQQIVYSMMAPWGLLFAAAAFCFLLSFFLSNQKINAAYQDE